MSSPRQCCLCDLQPRRSNSTSGVKVYQEPLSDCEQLQRHRSKVQTPDGRYLHAGQSGIKNEKNHSVFVCVYTNCQEEWSTLVTLLQNIKGFVSVEI